MAAVFMVLLTIPRTAKTRSKRTINIIVATTKRSDGESSSFAAAATAASWAVPASATFSSRPLISYLCAPIVDSNDANYL